LHAIHFCLQADCDFFLQAELAQQQACDKFEQISIKAKEGM
jgi:hypothetical protein